jgi:hypothetical protein
MDYINPRYLAHQRKRFLRQDWERYLRPDWERYMRPDWRDPKYWEGGVPRAHLVELADRNARRGKPMSAEEIAAAEQEIERERRALQKGIDELRRELGAIKRDLLLRRLTAKAYNPDQPRVPKGNDGAGRWTDEDGTSGRIQLAQLGGTLTDADGRSYYKPGGHHEMPQGIYTKWGLPPETRKVFDEATTGNIPRMRVRTTPDGAPEEHFWNGPGGAHGRYNEAVDELSRQFLLDNGIRRDQMTPDQARALLKEIRESQDPRIRDYNKTVRLLRRLFRLRGGRGID